MGSEARAVDHRSGTQARQSRGLVLRTRCSGKLLPPRPALGPGGPVDCMHAARARTYGQVALERHVPRRRILAGLHKPGWQEAAEQVGRCTLVSAQHASVQPQGKPSHCPPRPASAPAARLQQLAVQVPLQPVGELQAAVPFLAGGRQPVQHLWPSSGRRWEAEERRGRQHAEQAKPVPVVIALNDSDTRLSSDNQSIEALQPTVAAPHLPRGL